MLKSRELRQRFLTFFERRGHAIVRSDGLIPSGDPTVLFTSAGMSQFKDYFLGRKADLTRAASCQKCLRTGDLENVGRSPSHHSFFEMLGNFSFGDYFKAEAIQWGWEFLTGTTDYTGTPSPDRNSICLSLPKEKLWVSVYEEDEQAFTLWRKLGLPESRIKRFGQKENFWPANAPKEGPNGPCGPCSEIYYDPDGAVHGPKSIEVWNLVFTQFDRQPDGSLKPLPRPNIDTGMGLERLTRVIQRVETDYDTDLFTPIVNEIRMRRQGAKAKARDVEFSERAIADHMRAIVFLIAEGLMPSNEQRGYVLRMLIRRAYRLLRTTLAVPVNKYSGPGELFTLVEAVRITMVDTPYYDQLMARRQVIMETVRHEEEQFEQTLQAGTARLEELMRQAGTKKVISGAEAFKLYDTYGFPLELTVDLTEEQGFTVDQEGFRKELAAQQERSRADSQFGGEVFISDALKVRQQLPDLPSREQQFIGYESLQGEAVIQGLWDGQRWVREAPSGQTIGIVLSRSPFYGESGGQVGDTGAIEGVKGWAEVRQTTWVDDVLVHHALVRQGVLKVPEAVQARVNAERRLQVARSHTGTHLLHWALRKVLGPEAGQAGSLVEPERIRFDVTALKALDEEHLARVEALVNERARLADAVRTDLMPIDAAKQAGALAMFGEKYGQTVRVVRIGDYSMELCGGTHLAHTGFLGAFQIVGESSIASGTRRIEALVGGAAAEHQLRSRRLLHEAAQRLGRSTGDVVAGLEDVLEQLKHAERERKALQLELAKVEAARLVAEGKRINGVTFVTSTIKNADRELLTALADAVRGSLSGEGIVLLAGSDGPSSVSMVMATTATLSKRVHAGQLLKAVSPLTKGSGGGRPEFAQAGGKDPSGIPAAMKKAEELVREVLAA
ncbi:MAG: alanine--tRNA ligase [Candidatus Omnitrophica bacterium]|nr:alanine--tRNA ligase [Candidatus Omnitrophota bacterium]